MQANFYVFNWRQAYENKFWASLLRAIKDVEYEDYIPATGDDVDRMDVESGVGVRQGIVDMVGVG